MKIYITFLLFVFLIPKISAQQRDTLYLWSNEVPGLTEPKGPLVQSPNKKGNVMRIAKVTNPAVVVYEPNEINRNGVGIIVCPGGGYEILAIDKEGYEVAEWLSQLGYTAFVLQYRVPGKKLEALYDIQRAIRLIRMKAEDWNLDTEKLGVLGFSAGGSLSARASTLYNSGGYPVQDDADMISCRPDFAVLIYPAYLDKGGNRSLTPELKVNNLTPPMFIFGTANDKYANSTLVMTTALRDHDVPVELHLLPKGGHGYGLRPGKVAAETWPVLLKKWLENIPYSK